MVPRISNVIFRPTLAHRFLRQSIDFKGVSTFLSTNLYILRQQLLYAVTDQPITRPLALNR